MLCPFTAKANGTLAFITVSALARAVPAAHRNTATSAAAVLVPKSMSSLAVRAYGPRPGGARRCRRACGTGSAGPAAGQESVPPTEVDEGGPDPMLKGRLSGYSLDGFDVDHLHALLADQRAGDRHLFVHAV